MKKLYTLLAAAFMLLTSHNLVAADKGGNKDKQTIKTGWNVAPFPSIGYNSDTGFQMGALCELFYYGDGSTYPG